MDMYQRRALEGASGIELTIALYDGMIRFLREASRSPGRRRRRSQDRNKTHH